MTILDQPDRWKSIDPHSMHSLIESFPEHVYAASSAGLNFDLPDAKNAGILLVTGLGGSAIGGDLARAIAGRHLRMPFVVSRDYDLPCQLDASSVVIACSYSGNTEETISAYQQARRSDAAIVCITSGGQLESLGKADGYPVLKLPGGLPPRAALGHSLMTLLRALQKMQVIPNMDESIQETTELLRTLRDQYGASSPAKGNRAKTLANSLAGKVVAIYGSCRIMDAVAFRWRTQIEENAKNLALHQSLPEMNHNELVGWVYPEETLRRIGVVLLRDKEDHPQIQRRFDLTAEIIAGKSGGVHEVWSNGNSALARILSTLYLGDFVSLYMAYLNNVDPTPVEVIDYLKKELASGGRR
jgi:glucose/mannose-6-phosphate isomerase